MIKYLFVFLCLIPIVTIAKEIPRPDNDQLYTDFIMTKKNPLIKKEIVSSGYISMDGQKRFIYKQLNPSIFFIYINNNILTYKSGTAPAVSLTVDDKTEDSSNIAIFFSGDNEKIKKKYEVVYSSRDGFDFFTINPKSSLSTILYYEIYSQGDKVTKIIIYHKNKSIQTYTFQNTRTGVKPDENFFKY